MHHRGGASRIRGFQTTPRREGLEGAPTSGLPQGTRAAGITGRVRVRADAVVRSGLESGGVSTTREAHQTLRGRDVHPEAALVAHGLAALDDETLGFLADHPALVTWLYEVGAPVFATLAAHLRIHDGRVVPPGGPVAVPLWEAALNVSASQPEAFVRQLIGRSEGRLAFLYDVIGHLEPSRAAFALGSWIEDRGVRGERFRALVAVATSAHPEWDVKAYPFSRPWHDLMSMFSRVRVDPMGAPSFPASRAFWTHAFEASNPPRDSAGAHERLDSSRVIDAAWLAEAMVLGRLQRRSDRHDQFAFGQRAFARRILRHCPTRSWPWPRFHQTGC